MRPFLIVLAGVNGAGKSSVVSSLLRDEGLDWFNPDAFAAKLVVELGMPQDEANGHAWQQGFALLREAIATGGNHAFETTLGGRTIARTLAEASRTHDVLMLYCGLASPELHVERVAMRVAHHGHPIPQAKIRERWDSSRRNLIELMPRLARLQVFDNSRSVPPGEEVPDPVLLLDVAGGRIHFPEPDSAEALAVVPEWAQPIVEAAIRLDQRASPP